ncbi:MAG: IS1182 family transposase [Chloroflexi bacterium]|nr:IS1182 family transposase [Chloroflexota bacterium]
MLKPKIPQSSFYGSYLYDRIVPQDHLLRKINAVVDFSFVNDLVKDRYTPDFGRPAEDPEFMLRLCLLQYIYGDSDRQVEENARINLAYKYFLGLAVDEEPPDYSTVCTFRAQRLGEEKFRSIFENIVRQCIDKGLVNGKRQIIDSTHVVADMAITSLSGLIKLCRRNVLKTVENQDTKLAEKLGIKDLQVVKQDRFTRMEEGLEKEIDEARSLLDGVARELKDKKLRVTPELQKDLELLEKAVADRADEAKDRLVSPVDPDARMGKKDHKRWAGYKGHVIVEEESEIITSVETTPANRDDGSQLRPLLKQQEEAHSLVPDEISGDKAYGSGANLERLDEGKITGYISLAEKINIRGADLFTVEDFRYDEATETVTCPAGCVTSHSKRDLVMTEDQRRHGIVFQFSRCQCADCELRPKCFNSNSKIHGRAVHISHYHSYYHQMQERMESEEGKEAYRNRYKIEHKVADLARWCGMRRCRYRGLSRARIHTLLAATVSNIKRMARLLWKTTDRPPLERAMAA